ncbi:VOC family protein [Agromyces sp. Marseille-P2726]|uniref:VOC family protein n=1 Tax=Agromyces sp. Marseille-P2726 TaxID=2709132 RepID=UPI00156D5627|nr:VOC family protein [Agromyces sp. Marseille-P2726]
MTDAAPSPVLQLRVVVEAADYDQAVAFFRDSLGLPEYLSFAEGGDERVVILDAGRATLEIANPVHKEAIDRVEAGGAESPHIRLAFEVTDTEGMTRRLEGAGGRVIAEPVVTPWQSLNSRLGAPAGVQVTLFQELLESGERAVLDGFSSETERREGGHRPSERPPATG